MSCKYLWSVVGPKSGQPRSKVGTTSGQHYTSFGRKCIVLIGSLSIQTRSERRKDLRQKYHFSPTLHRFCNFFFEKLLANLG